MMKIENPVFLYVEDDPMSRTVGQMMLTRVMGFQNLTIFEDSADFTSRLELLKPAPNVILLDIQMMPCDGYEVLEMLRKLPRFEQTIVIALTANVMANDVDQLKQVGFNGLIGKPLMKDIFPELIERILDGESVWYIP